MQLGERELGVRFIGGKNNKINYNRFRPLKWTRQVLGECRFALK